MIDQEIREGQLQRAKRLREQIERLKSGHAIQSSDQTRALHEKIEEPARTARIIAERADMAPIQETPWEPVEEPSSGGPIAGSAPRDEPQGA